MFEVEVTSGQSWNFIFFHESSQSSHSLVEIILLHKIIRYSRRISQARERPKLRNTMLKRLNSTLQEKTPSVESLTAHLRYYSSEPRCELAMA
jgi:hypothetical protein